MGIDDQFFLGPELLVAPVTAQEHLPAARNSQLYRFYLLTSLEKTCDQGATWRRVYFPAGALWQNFWNGEL